MNSYIKKRNALVKRFKRALTKNEDISLGKKTSNLFRQRKAEGQKIDVTNFNQIIKINRSKKVCEVEGMITYEDLVKETLKYNLVPAFVPELKTITIGGEIAGIGVESSCFKYGFAHETVLETEILLGDGKIVKCSPKINSDLFYGFPNTYGTLGYVLRAKIKLINAKKYVKLTRKKYSNIKKYYSDMQKISFEQRKKGKISYIDGLIFRKDELYIVLGEFVDEAPYVSDCKKEIYYKSFRNKKVDYLTTYDYLFRYDPDWFWISRHFGLENKIIRFLWGKKNLNSGFYYKIMSLNRKYKIGERLKPILGMKKTETLIQDIEIPIEKAEKFTSWILENIGIVPMTVGPVIPCGKKEFSMFPMKKGKLYINLGFYDYIESDKPKNYYDKLIEKKMLEMKLKKMLYSTNHFTKKEFWRLYNKKTYDKLKRKYDPNKKFKNLYDKCVLRE